LAVGYRRLNRRDRGLDGAPQAPRTRGSWYTNLRRGNAGCRGIVGPSSCGAGHAGGVKTVINGKGGHRRLGGRCTGQRRPRNWSNWLGSRAFWRRQLAVERADR
jgi:hypothetical protein